MFETARTLPSTGAASAATVPQYRLSDVERRALSRLADRVTADPVAQPDWFCRQARSAARHLPDGLVEALWGFAETGYTAGVLALRNLEVGPLPPTPPDTNLGLGGGTLLARAQAIVGEALGELVSYEAEAGGHLLQDMVPNRANSPAQHPQGSSVELGVHTEQCFSALRPDYVLLGCLRGDAGAATYAFPARSLVALLDPARVRALYRPLWTTTVDCSFAGYVDADEVRGPVPILSGDPDDPVLVVDQDLMRGTTPAAQELLDTVVQHYARHRHAHVLVPGDLLVLDNQRAMHGRSAFRPGFDGSDRFVTRSFVVRDLRRSRYARPGNTRTIAAQFG